MNLTGELWARLDQMEIIYDPDKYFSDNFAMTVTLVIETWFKDTAYSLCIQKHFVGELWARLGQGREDMLQTGNLGRTDRCIDWSQKVALGVGS